MGSFVAELMIENKIDHIELEKQVSENPSLEIFFIASTWKRLAAFFIDRMIAFFIFTPVILQVVSGYFQDQNLKISWFWLILCFLLEITYHVVFLKILGATVGKMIFGLRVVTYRTHENLRWFQCVLRVLTDHLSFFFGESLRVLALFRFDRRHVSDWVAETQVVQFTRRLEPARPRRWLALILFFYFFANGFLSAYRLFQKGEVDGRYLILHLGENISDRQESGTD